jgi:FAD/FMN-containing dehydrogenase
LEGRNIGPACGATHLELLWVVEQLMEAGAPFVVQGAGTGLVAGATPSQDGAQ